MVDETPLNPFDRNPSGNDPLVTVLKLANQNMSQLITQVQTRFGAQSATFASVGITATSSTATLVTQGTGYLTSISVIVASTGTGFVYDSDTIISVGSSAAIGIIPSSGMMTYNWPYTRGIVVQPSTNQTISVSYASTSA